MNGFKYIGDMIRFHLHIHMHLSIFVYIRICDTNLCACIINIGIFHSTIIIIIMF